MRTRIVACAVCVALALGALGCSKQARLQATAVSLNTVAQGVNVAWAVSMQAALAEERAVVAEADPSSGTLAQAQARLREVRERWDERFAKFAAIREAHEVAVAVFKQVRAGVAAMSELLAALQNVLRLYQRAAEQLDLPKVPEPAAGVLL